MTPKFSPDLAAELVAQLRDSRRCKACHGDGYSGYGDTSCGRGGAGGQTITVAECHRCKGQGWIGAPDVTTIANQLDAACDALRELQLDRDQLAAISSKVNDAINRAGIHCALFYWEAIDQLAAERDSLRSALSSSRAKCEELRKERDEAIRNYDQLGEELEQIVGGDGTSLERLRRLEEQANAANSIVRDDWNEMKAMRAELAKMRLVMRDFIDVISVCEQQRKARGTGSMGADLPGEPLSYVQPSAFAELTKFARMFDSATKGPADE